jgi:cytochrome c oxidase cbb3-type subunit I/II
VLKFFVAGVTFYGMATLEGHCLVKSVSALAHHRLDIATQRRARLNGFMAAGMFYRLVPKLFGTAPKLQAAGRCRIDRHAASCSTSRRWVSGISQVSCRRAETDGGLVYND